MRHVTCLSCGAQVAAAQSFRVFDREPLCESCGNQELAARKLSKVPPGSVVRGVDPTICARCGTDWGNVTLQTVGRNPMCAQCIAVVRNFPIPQWLKLGLAATLLLVVAGWAHNARYFRGVARMRSALSALQGGKFDDASALMLSAAADVPESPDMGDLAKFFHALSLVRHDKSADALKELDSVQAASVTQQQTYKLVHAQAAIGVAFDKHDYDAFLKEALGLLKDAPKESRVLGTVASAYACKFAATGDEQFRTLSVQYLEQAKKAGPKDLGDLPARLAHRIATREIIDDREYHRRFGGKPEAD